MKIGFTSDLPGRLKALESHYRSPMAVLATMDGGRAEERQIHDRFVHLRLGRTEQFRPAAELMEFIGRPLLVSRQPLDEMRPMPGSGGIALSIRAMPEWEQWLEGAAAHDRTTVPQWIDRALVLFAKETGFTEPAPPRIRKPGRRRCNP